MELLEQYIAKNGKVIGDDVLKVDMFLNHQIDPQLMLHMGEEFCRLFEHEKITKVLTIEVSGIAIAVMAALKLQVPLVYAKKTVSVNCSDDVYESEVFSFTKKTMYKIRVAKEYLNENDRVLIIDDFLANGNAALGLISLTESAGATPVGVGIAIEKGFMPGRQMLKEKGIRLESLAIVQKMSENQIIFGKNDEM